MHFTGLGGVGGVPKIQQRFKKLALGIDMLS